MIDVTRRAELQEAIELMFFAYRAFTTPPDTLLAEQSLGRVHHRVLYFVARQPGLSVNQLLATLGVSKQALNAPLRKLQNLNLIDSSNAAHDKRLKELRLTPKGQKLEAQLSQTQMDLLQGILQITGTDAEQAWKQVMRDLAQASKSK
jgi:DNA-binding MarR family transcriptional regulator